MRLVLLVVAVALLGAVPAAGQEKKGRRYALLIGVQKYDSADLHDLEYSDKDVEDLAAALRGAGYKAKDVTVLSTREKGEAPTEKAIRAALKAFVERDYAKEDVALIAFSGHGVQVGKKFYFCPAGARLADKGDKPEGLISVDELYQQLKRCKAGFRLLLTDCCRNNPFRAARKIRVVGEEADLGEGMPRDVVMITSCSPGQKAYEDKDLGHGVFFHFVIEGVKSGKADLNEDGKVTRTELESYLRLKMAKHKSKQAPETITRSRLDPPLAVLGVGPEVGVLQPLFRLNREYVEWFPYPVFSPDGKAAVVLEGSKVEVFDLQRRRRLGSLNTITGMHSNVAVTRSGLAFAGGNPAGSTANEAVFVSPLTGKVVAKVPLKFSPWLVGTARGDRRFFAAHGPKVSVMDGRLKVLDTFDLGSEKVTAGALAGGGERLITGTEKGKVFVFDVDKGAQLHELEGHKKKVVAAHASKDGSKAYTICQGGKLIVWDVEKGNMLKESDIRSGTNGAHSAAFQQDGRRAVVGYLGGAVAVVDIAPGGEAKLRATHTKHSTGGHTGPTVTVTPDGSQAASVFGKDLWIYGLPRED